MDTKILHVVLEESDHAMLVLSTDKMWVRLGRRFMYDARWRKMAECRDMVAGEWHGHFWGSYVFGFFEKLKALWGRLRAWYNGRGRNSK
ncbi:hypothetical protein ACFX1X_041115 [Malus domestica]